MPKPSAPVFGFAAARTRPTPSLASCRLWLVAALGLASTALGCAAGDRTLAEVDPQAAPLHPTYEQVFAIVESNCAPCHGGGSAVSKREDGEGDDLDYATCLGLQNGIDGLRSTVLEGGSMPPGAWPRIADRDKLLIQRWIEDGACSPCTSACP